MFKSFSFLIILQRGLENISLNLKFFKVYLKKIIFKKILTIRKGLAIIFSLFPRPRSCSGLKFS